MLRGRGRDNGDDVSAHALSSERELVKYLGCPFSNHPLTPFLTTRRCTGQVFVPTSLSLFSQAHDGTDGRHPRARRRRGDLPRLLPPRQHRQLVPVLRKQPQGPGCSRGWRDRRARGRRHHHARVLRRIQRPRLRFRARLHRQEHRRQERPHEQLQGQDLAHRERRVSMRLDRPELQSGAEDASIYPPCTLNHKPRTSHPKPQTLATIPQILNP